MFRITFAALILLVATGCNRTQRSELVIYDWEAQRGTLSEHGAHDLRCKPAACPDPGAKTVYVFDAPKLGGDDIERKSVRVDADPVDGAPILILQLSPAGQERFTALTRTLAKRGARMKEPQHFLIAIDGVVYASPYVDYRRNPDGIPGDNGLQLSGLTSLGEARELAKALRDDD